MSNEKRTVNVNLYPGFWLTLIILFWGTPDIHDAIIAWLMQ